MSAPATLAVSNLRTRFGGASAGANVVDGVTFTLQPGRTTALVGESGCGKSVTALSLMRLIEPPGHIVSGSVTLDGRDLLTLDEREMEQVRGARIGMVFQDPLTALDVTVQAKILRLLHDLQRDMGAALLLITHDLGVVAAMADEVLVMYAGRIVERADVDKLFHNPRHPYTKALLACVAGIEDDRRTPLEPIGGSAPDLRHPPPGG